MINRLQKTSHLWRLSLLLSLLITDEVDSAFYRRCFSLTEYSLCLSTDTSLFVNWNDARTWCASNNSALIDVSSSEVQSILDTFRNDGSSQLRTLGNWIDVTCSGLTNWHWINGTPSVNFMVSGSQSSGEAFAAITSINNQASFSAQTYDKNLRYICQFDADVSCSGGYIRASKCYLKYSDTSSWFGASNRCLDKNGQLATFTGLYAPSNDTGLTSWLQLSGTDAYWIGLIQTTFKRFNGNEVQYSKWSTGHPHLTLSMSPKRCILYGSYGWQDTFDCSASQRFVCQGTGIGIGFAVGLVTAFVIWAAVYTTVNFVCKRTSRVNQLGNSTVNERPSVAVDSNELFNNNNYMSLSTSTLSEPQVYEKMQKTQVLG